MELKVINDNGQMAANFSASDDLFGREYNEALVHQALDRFRSGASMAQTMTEVPSAEERSAAQDAVRAFYAGKNRLRVAITTAALEEGLSVAEIAEVFTIPHDVVASISAEHPRAEVS